MDHPKTELVRYLSPHCIQMSTKKVINLTPKKWDVQHFNLHISLLTALIIVHAISEISVRANNQPLT